MKGRRTPSIDGMNREPVPRLARVAFTLWIAAWAPIIVVTYGVQNFWWLCNIAQFIVLYALWRPNALLVSSQAGTLVFIGFVWTLDLAIGVVVGDSVTGITAYMFDPDIPLPARLTSTYHVWLPFLVLWMCWRNGYDRRGVWLQCVIGTAAIAGARLGSEPERNINFAFEPFHIEQVWMPDGVYVVLLMIATAVLVYLPGHGLVRLILSQLPRRWGGMRS